MQLGLVATWRMLTAFATLENASQFPAGGGLGRADQMNARTTTDAHARKGRRQKTSFILSAWLGVCVCVCGGGPF